jgi:hypothetical protein
MYPRVVGCVVAYIALAAASGWSRVIRAAAVPGIAFTIDTVVLAYSTIDESRRDEATDEYDAFATFIGNVAYAAGRGRLDIVAKRKRPAVLVDGIAMAAPLAVTNEYYLFDSTGFILVHPATRTFSSFTISEDSYNHQGHRDGWPDFFQFFPPHLDTLRAGTAIAQHGPIDVYWHADAGAIAIARGRFKVDDAPMSEVNVARWFAASRALAHVADSAHALPNGRVTVTAAIPRKPRGAGPAVISFALKHVMSNLRIADVDVSRLILPGGFTEVPWPGYESVSSPPGLSADKGARWRTSSPGR